MGNTTKERILDEALALFAEMMKNGILKKDDSQMLAFAYTVPISTLVHFCGRERDQEPEIIGQIEDFVRRFIKTYER